MKISRHNLRSYMIDQLGLDSAEFEDDTPLFSEGLLDSFSLAELIAYIEEGGGLTIKPTDITLENLDSVERILAFVESKQV